MTFYLYSLMCYICTITQLIETSSFSPLRNNWSPNTIHAMQEIATKDSSHSSKFQNIDEATETMIPISGPENEGISLWVRTWGCQPSNGGIPVLFVHGGPGNSVDDYKNINEDFFDATKFFVIEVGYKLYCPVLNMSYIC